jgi:hypothetical protein
MLALKAPKPIMRLCFFFLFFVLGLVAALSLAPCEPPPSYPPPFYHCHSRVVCASDFVGATLGVRYCSCFASNKATLEWQRSEKDGEVLEYRWVRSPSE